MEGKRELPKRIYLLGYQGKKPADIAKLVAFTNAKLIDIRLDPTSPNPQWRQAAFVKLVGDEYYHLVTLGNKAYRDARIEIVNLSAGVEWLEGYHRENPNRPIVLMCGCKDSSTCHRTVVGDHLKKVGWAVAEVQVRVKPCSQCDASGIAETVGTLNDLVSRGGRQYSGRAARFHQCPTCRGEGRISKGLSLGSSE